MLNIQNPLLSTLPDGHWFMICLRTLGCGSRITDVQRWAHRDWYRSSRFRYEWFSLNGGNGWFEFYNVCYEDGCCGYTHSPNHSVIGSAIQNGIIKTVSQGWHNFQVLNYESLPSTGYNYKMFSVGWDVVSPIVNDYKNKNSIIPITEFFNRTGLGINNTSHYSIVANGNTNIRSDYYAIEHPGDGTVYKIRTYLFVSTK